MQTDGNCKRCQISQAVLNKDLDRTCLMVLTLINSGVERSDLADRLAISKKTLRNKIHLLKSTGYIQDEPSLHSGTPSENVPPYRDSRPSIAGQPSLHSGTNGGDYRGGDSPLNKQQASKPENTTTLSPRAQADGEREREMQQALTRKYQNQGVVVEDGVVSLVNGTKTHFLKRFGGDETILAEKLMGVTIQENSYTPIQAQVCRQLSAAADSFAARQQRNPKPQDTISEICARVGAKLAMESAS